MALMNNTTIRRNICDNVHAALADTPVVFISGARQTGKSTLVQAIGETSPETQYYTMDDIDILKAAKLNPKGFIDGLPHQVIIDEIQRVPEILLPIKIQVDQNRFPGRFLLTGSANVFVLPHLSESLAGRTEIITLYPFSQGELLNKKESFIDALFTKDNISEITYTVLSEEELWQKIITGGYPEIIRRPQQQRRIAWFKSYISTLIQRDILDISRIESTIHLPNLLSLLAGRCSQLLNFSDLSRTIQIPQTSLKRYFSLLESIFLIYRLYPWYKNLNTRLVKSQKIFFLDTGLLSYLLGLDETNIHENGTIAGHVFENFVITEIQKQISWSLSPVSLFYYRSHSGMEVDAVLENNHGKCVCIEIKATSTITTKDIKGLLFLKESLKSNFSRGIILYPGKTIIPFAEDIYAIPVSSMWETAS